MDHPWRHLPIQGNICPTCSISHFPLCPPRASFDQNPRFLQLQNDHSFPRPFFDPFVDNRGSVGTHRPFIGNQNDGFVDPRSWHRNPSLERDSYLVGGIHRDGFAPQPRYDHGSNGFASEELNMGDRNTKRMRVDEMGSGSFTGEHHLNPSRVMSDDARRLKLIRDHGGVSSGPPLGGTDPILGMNMGFNHETKGYIEESSVSERNFGNRRSDELWGSRTDMAAPKHMSNMEQGIGFGQYMQSDRNGFQSDIDHTLFRKKGGVHSQNEEFVQSRGQVKNPRQTYEHNGLPTLGPNNVEQALQSQGVGALHHEEGIHRYTDWGEGYFSTSHKGDLNQQPRMYQRVPHLVSDVPNENYDTHNLWQIQPSDSMSAKEPHYSHTANWQVFSGSSAPNYEQRSSIPTESRASNNQLPQSHVFYSPGQLSDARQSFQVKLPSLEGNQGSGGHTNLAVVAQYGPVDSNKQGYLPIPTSSRMVSENMGHMQTSRVFGIQPPLPTSPPPPLPVDPPGPPLSEKKASSSLPKTSSSLFPVPVSSSATAPSSYPPVPEAHSVAQPNFHNKPHLHVSSGLVTGEFQAIHRTSSKQYLGEGQPFPSKHMSSDKPKIIDASHLFRQPHRATRPDHIVIILRGLPGSGKSYLAKMLRDLEVENGGYAPRIHSMDDYFMTEVEKAEENEVSKSSTSVRGKKAIMKKVMEYCYEPEMEEAYRSSMLKAFKKTLEEGVFTFIIVDDRNLRVADFAQFWAIGKRSGYEVYLLEATYKDPVGCAARNVHGFTQDDIEKMAGLWEEAPSLYLQLDVKSLFHGDDLKESGIQEVDMDTGDGDFDEDLFGSQERKLEIISPPAGDYAPDGSSKDGNKWDVEGDHPTEEVKELGRSKWSDDFDEDDTERSDSAKGNLNALSGLIQAYGKEGKSVRWGDQAGNAGFSIGAAKKATVLALVIGPGAGYNLKSNPLPEENPTSTQNTGESRRQGIFQERLRAEHESFRAVFDKRRQRIGGLDVEEE